MPRQYKKLLAYLAILVIPFLFLFLKASTFNPFKSTVVASSVGPLKLVAVPVNEIKKLIFYHQIYAQNQKLKEETGMLRSRLIGQEELVQENSRFKKLLGFKSEQKFPSVIASVIGREPSNWNAAVLIDKGEIHGLKQGMPVVDALGVVGKVAEVGKRTSKVILLNDPNFSVAALVQRSREGGLVTGTLTGICRMKYLSPTANVEVGDKVITSRLSSSFPEGILVGEVTAVEESRGSPTIECLIEPAVTLSQLEEVIVIKK